MPLSILLAGFALWAAGTAAIRLSGQHLLEVGRSTRTLLLYAVSFALMAVAAPAIFSALQIDPANWPTAAIGLMLPTLVLDSIACLFFTKVYPNVNPAAAGLFGGWMLICCAGPAIGSLVRL